MGILKDLFSRPVVVGGMKSDIVASGEDEKPAVVAKEADGASPKPEPEPAESEGGD